MSHKTTDAHTYDEIIYFIRSMNSTNNKPSGHAFHYEVEDRIKNKGWEIKSELSYLDDVEHKPRKVDIVALQERESFNPRGNKLALIVECKYLEHDVTLWMRDNARDHGTYFIDGYNTNELFHNDSRFHFFTTDKVAVNMEERKVGKNSLYEAVMQASKAMMYLRQGGQLLHTKGLFYPMVIYKGVGKITDQDNNVLKNTLYHHYYEWRDTKTQVTSRRSVYVDIIHETCLEEYLNNVYKEEMDTLMNHVFFKQRMQENKQRQQKRGNIGL